MICKRQDQYSKVAFAFCKMQFPPSASQERSAPYAYQSETVIRQPCDSFLHRLGDVGAVRRGDRNAMIQQSLVLIDLGLADRCADVRVRFFTATRRSLLR